MRSLSATSSSMELERVNFSDTPSSGRRSRIRWDFISSSRASTLMRIFFIYELNVSVGIPNFQVLRPCHPEFPPRSCYLLSYQIRPPRNRENPRLFHLSPAWFPHRPAPP